MDRYKTGFRVRLGVDLAGLVPWWNIVGRIQLWLWVKRCEREINHSNMSKEVHDLAGKMLTDTMAFGTSVYRVEWGDGTIKAEFPKSDIAKYLDKLEHN